MLLHVSQIMSLSKKDAYCYQSVSAPLLKARLGNRYILTTFLGVISDGAGAAKTIQNLQDHGKMTDAYGNAFSSWIEHVNSKIATTAQRNQDALDELYEFVTTNRDVWDQLQRASVDADAITKAQSVKRKRDDIDAINAKLQHATTLSKEIMAIVDGLDIDFAAWNDIQSKLDTLIAMM